MRSKFYLSFGLSVLFFLFSMSTFAQTFTPEKIMTPIAFDKSKALRDIEPVQPGYRDRSWKDKVVPNKDGFLEEFNNPSTFTGPDPVLQDYSAAGRSTATIAENFAGVPNLSGVAPPDTDGDVGPNHYMQMVNLAFQIFDKNGNSLYGPADNSTLWDGFTGEWTGTNDGDPIVLYDQYADRWIASQFALPNYPSGPFYELIAVSETGDPTGAWYRYAYEFSNMPDYPKFGVWPDGYYFTINQFAPPSLSFAGGGICVVDRAAMIAGDPEAGIQFFNLGTSYGSLLPSDADGTSLPPAGTPNYLLNMAPSSYVRLFSASIDWGNPSNSQVTVEGLIQVSAYSYSGFTIRQPGTSQTLDALSTRLMYRLQYRNFGTYQVMLTNHTVNSGLGYAGVRWYEFRNYGSGWTVHQQGTFAPSDANNRWMGSVAMNGNGDIAVGYSVSGSGTYPAVRFAGQTASNSGTGILDVAETSILDGTASQTGVNRWGDYSMMSVDPTDDNTFWYTNEYSSGGWNWKTQIASFDFGEPVYYTPVADFSGNPTSIVEGQSVSFSDLSQNNPTSWEWTFSGGTPSTSAQSNPVVVYPTAGTYDVSLTVSNPAGSDTETKTGYITVEPYVPSYCVSAGSSTSYGWIDSFSLGSYTKSSGNNNGYADFTGETVQVESGQTYTLTGIPGFPGRAQKQYWRVWVDYNHDYDFEDAGEEIFAANNARGTVSGSITIPSGLTGETRMKVAMQYNAVPTACGSFTYGEVEEYTLAFGTPTPQPPVADFTGSPTTIEEGGSVQFTDNSLNNPTSWSWTFEGGTPGTSTAQNPLVAYSTAGTYDVTLTATNGQGSDTKTLYDYITVNTGGGGGGYCSSTSTSNALDYISGVQIGSSSNSSGASLYSDFTSFTFNLTPGSTNNVILTPTFTGKVQREFWRIWIDFNGDKDFEDADETLLVANNQRDVVISSIDIPSYASGTTRMRITMKNGGSPSPCETFTYGEVEDYTVSFGSAPAKAEKVSGLDISLYPNPAGNEINVEITSGESAVKLRLYSALGVILDELDTRQQKVTLDLGKYGPGVYYVGAENSSQSALKKFIKN